MIDVDQMLRLTDPVHGWMSRAERVWLYEQARRLPPGGCWVEVGTWRGRSFFAVACGLAAGCWLYAVDHWRHKGHCEHDPDMGNWRRFAQSLADFNAEVRDDLNYGLLVAPSLEAAARFPPGTADAVFVDGGHHAHEVKADVLAWRPAVRPGGLLAGHDRNVDGVPLALAEALPHGYTVPADTIWEARGT